MVTSWMSPRFRAAPGLALRLRPTRQRGPTRFHRSSLPAGISRIRGGSPLRSRGRAPRGGAWRDLRAELRSGSRSAHARPLRRGVLHPDLGYVLGSELSYAQRTPILRTPQVSAPDAAPRRRGGREREYRSVDTDA